MNPHTTASAERQPSAAARKSAFKLKERITWKNMLSRRQLKALARLRASEIR
jgi:hypothetical protein